MGLDELKRFLRKHIPDLETRILRREPNDLDILDIVMPRQGLDCWIRPSTFTLGVSHLGGLFLNQRSSPSSHFDNWHGFSGPLRSVVNYFKDTAAFKFHQPLTIHGVPTCLEVDCFFDLTSNGTIFNNLSLLFPSRLLCADSEPGDLGRGVFTVIAPTEEFRSLCYRYCFCNLPAEVMQTYLEKVLK